MKQRIITGTILAAVILIVFLLRDVNLLIFDTFISFISVIAVAEVSRVFLRSGKANFMEVAVTYVVLVFLVFIWGINSSFDFGQYLFSQIGLLMLMFAVSFSLGYFNKKYLKKEEYYKSNESSEGNIYEYSVKKALQSIFIMIYPGLILSFLYLINHIKDLRLSPVSEAYLAVDLGLILLAMLFLTTIFTDTFAYFVGKSVGGKKLAPLISPKKTVAGAIGGIVGSFIISIMLFMYLNSIAIVNVAFFGAEVTLWHFALYGLLASVVSQAGDLFASVVKRRARAKDYGTILPGHGGIMDRLDGISFNSVFTFIYALIFFL